jgi:hypothetical protein
MSAASLPGFTADVSLYKTRNHYQTAAATGHNKGVSPQLWPICSGVGEPCSFRFPCCSGPCINGQCACTSGSDCSTGWCNENGQCDCFGVGEECRFGAKSCCSGHCGPDLTCTPPPAIDLSWEPICGSLKGWLTVTGHNFPPRTEFELVDPKTCDRDPCDPPLTLGVVTDKDGQFSTRFWQCECSNTDFITILVCDPGSINCGVRGRTRAPCC